MRLLDRYILRNFLTPFLLCFFGFLSIWLVMDLQSNLHDFLEARVGVGWLARYYLALLPQFLMLCIPVGLLLALLFCLSKMSRANEIIAMLTSGQSLTRVLSPLFAFGLFLSLFCVAINYSLAPSSDSVQKELRDQIRKKARGPGPELKSQSFRNRNERRSWFVTSMPAKVTDDAVLTGVDIWEQDENGHFPTIWYAQTARYKPQTKTWLLYNGKVVKFAGDKSVASVKPFQTLQIKTWSETPWRIASSELDAQLLSVPELRKYLAVNADFPPKTLAPYRTHLQYRWALPFQCLAVVLFAAPLSIVYSRRGVFSGIALAIFLFALMMFFGFLMLALGKGHRVSEWTAAWLPILLFCGIGVVLLYRKATNRSTS